MRCLMALIVVALIGLPPQWAAAKGGAMRLPEPKPIAAGLPLPGMELSPKQILGGCGPKRYRDAASHKCRGPADFDN